MKAKLSILICLTLCLLLCSAAALAADHSATATIDLVFDGMTFTDTVQVEWNERYVVPEGGVKWDGSEDFIGYADKENWKIINKSEFSYVDGQIVFMAELGDHFYEVEQIAAKYGARIVAYFALTEDYVIELVEDRSLDTMLEIIQELKNESLLIDNTIMPHYVDYVAYNAVPNDPWEGAEWNENMPQGHNWGVEAIHALSAWDYSPFMAEKRIAIIDSMFWDNHEDISFAVIRDLDVNNDTSINATDYAHGTHVTGIALAKHDNSLGISGVFPKGKAVAIGTAGVNRANPGDNNQPMYWIEYKESILVALINDAHVINQSMGFGFDDDTTPNDDGEMLTAEEKRTNHINNRNELVSYYNGFFGNFFSALEQMTEIEKAAGNTRSYDFIFVNSAGNDEIDAQHNWWSQYITDPAFTERLLTVGSVGQNEQGELVYSSFSNWGTAVNIAAPGENILSTVPADYKLYQTLGGTSMAAPHVAGVAAMVWSISPKELTGPEVVDIILENSVLPITDSRNYSYPFLDAYSSTKDAFEKSQAKGLVFGTVTDSKTFNHLNAEVSFIPESICNADSIIHIPQIGASGTYEIELPIGFYELQVSKAGYITHQEHILVTSDKNIQISTALVPNMNIPEVTKGTINGSITLNSLAVSGIEIDILDGTTHVATTITNEAGQFIVDLDPGTYVLSIDVEGYVPVSKNTTVFVGKTTTENIELDDSMYATVEMRRIDYLNHYIINIHNAKKSVEQIDFKLTLVNGTILYDTAQGIINDSWRIEDEIVFILDDELIQGSELVVTSTDGNGRHYEGSIILGAAWRDGQSATLIAR